MRVNTLATVLCWLCLGLVTSATATTEIEVTAIGWGDTQALACDDAMKQALSQAVQQALGVDVNVTSLAEVERVFYQSFVETRGVVDRYEEIGTPMPMGRDRCQRTIHAWVSEVSDAAVEDFIRQVRRVGVFVQEPVFDDRRPALTALQQALSRQDIQVVDLSPAKEEVQALMRAQDKRPLLRRYLVDAVIATSPIRVVAGEVGEEGRRAGIISRRAEASARLVFIDQADVPYNADESLKAVGPESIEQRLIREAHQKFGRKLADVFGPVLDDHFAATKLTVILEDVPDVVTFRGLTRSMRSILTGSEVVPGDYQQHRSEILVNYGEGTDADETRMRVADILEDAGAEIIRVTETAARVSFAAEPDQPVGADLEDSGSSLPIDTKTLLIAVLGLAVIILVVVALRRGKGGTT